MWEAGGSVLIFCSHLACEASVFLLTQETPQVTQVNHGPSYVLLALVWAVSLALDMSFRGQHAILWGIYQVANEMGFIKETVK